MKTTRILSTSLVALACLFGHAKATLVFTETFDNSTNQALVTTISGWNYAMSSGNSSTDNSGQRQIARMSDLDGFGGAQGYVYNVTGGGSGGPQARGSVVWYNGSLDEDKTPGALSLAQSDLLNLSVYIGHANTTSTTRFLIEIEDEGWFVTTQSWTHSTGMGGDEWGDKEEEVSWNFTTAGSSWASLAYDGLVDSASSGFAILDSDPSGLPDPLPAGNITAVGVYHTNSTAWESTRFDNFSVTVIPEPGTLVLVGISLGSLLLFRRRR